MRVKVLKGTRQLIKLCYYLIIEKIPSLEGMVAACSFTHAMLFPTVNSQLIKAD